MTTSGSAGAARLVLEGGTADGDDRMAPSLDAWQSALEALLAEKRAVKAASSAAVAKTSVATTATTVTSAGGGAAAGAGVSPNGTVHGALRVTADKGHFAAVYEASLLMLEQLTPHQRTVLAAVSTARHVLLEAPAGGGKTFVAMARILEVLLGAPGSAPNGAHDDATDEPSFAVEKTAKVLFTCWSAPLCLFVCRWICKRVRDAVQRRLQESTMDLAVYERNNMARYNSKRDLATAMVDYSKWDNIKDSDDEEETPPKSVLPSNLASTAQQLQVQSQVRTCNQSALL